jgi:hypothetical protein
MVVLLLEFFLNTDDTDKTDFHGKNISAFCRGACLTHPNVERISVKIRFIRVIRVPLFFAQAEC